jgi:orotate phosphoribosyltransferase
MSSSADLDDLAARIRERCQVTGEFVLRSGAVTDRYFDKFLLHADPVLLREIAEAVASLIPEETEVLAGLEMGAIPLVTVVSQVTGLPARFVRKKPKAYGTQRLAEGGDIEGKRLTVLEDVVTTGGQVIDSCTALRVRGADILAVVCVIDRQAGGRDTLAARDLELRALLEFPT